MGRNYQDITIDDEVYTFRMLRPRVATKTLVRLFKIIGPPIGKAFTSSIKMKDVLDADVNIGGAISELSDRLDSDEIQDIIDTLFTQVQHKGEGELTNEIAYNACFSGRQKHLYKVVSTALEVQYADFLEGEDALSVIIKKAKQQMGEATTKPSTQEIQT